MAASVVTRSHWTDDSGGGTDGTIINEAELQKIYANVDLLNSGTGAYATLEFGGNVRVDGSIFGGITLLDKSTTQQDVTNTVTETSVYSFSVLGGTLSTSQALRLSLSAKWIDNAGAGGNTVTVKFKYGPTTCATFNLVSAGLSVNPMWIEASALLNANGATNSQRSSSVLDFGSATTDGLPSGATHYIANHGSLAVDSAAAQVFTCTVTQSVASASLTFSRFLAMLELCAR